MTDKSPESNDSFVEKRRFARAYFSSDDDVTGIIIVPYREKPAVSGNISHLSIGGNTTDLGLDGSIHDLSIGGLYLILKRDQADHLAVGDMLTLKEIQATILSHLELNVEMVIRRVHNYEFVEYVGLGCEFTSIGDNALEGIKRLVEWGMNTNSNTR